MSGQAVGLQTHFYSLLAPIPGGSPAGESLRYEGAYDRIQEDRREDDPTLSQGVWKVSMKKADWAEVEQLCAGELQTRTKDLQIAAWLMESWVHQRKFQGISDGLELLEQLLERYWDTIH